MFIGLLRVQGVISMANKTGVEGPCKIATYTDMDWHAHLAIYDGSGTGPEDESSWVDIDLNNLNQYNIFYRQLFDY